jgi:hypothetical protein
MKTHQNFTVPCGLFLMGLCVFIRYQIGRRRFYRRGIGGLQHFPGYAKAVTVTLLERLCLVIANVCGLAGIFLLAVEGFNHMKF